MDQLSNINSDESDLTLAWNLGPTGCAYDFADFIILTVICDVHFSCQSDSGCVVRSAASDRGRRKRCRSWQPVVVFWGWKTLECTWLPFLLVIIDTSFVIHDNQPSSAIGIVVALLEEFVCHYLFQICYCFLMAKRIWNPGYVHIVLPALTKKYVCYASRLTARWVAWELTRESCKRPAAAKGTCLVFHPVSKQPATSPYSMHSIHVMRCSRHAKKHKY